MLFLNWASFVKWIVLFIVVSPGRACRPEVCRRKRSPGVTLQLRGCSGETAPWVVQVAYCLNISSFDAAFGMRDWYERAYDDCQGRCDAVREGTVVTVDINTCVDCFKESFERSNVLDNFQTISAVQDVFPCVDAFTVPFLNEALPSLETTSSDREKLNARVDLPPAVARPADQWWGLTVRLPCKPPLFQFVDANCINAFVDDVRARDFVLTQNRVINKDDIQFVVTFNDACRFDPSEIEIVWDKSIPGFALPQMSSFPSSAAPTGEEFGNIFFDSGAFSIYQRTVANDLVRRRKRSPQNFTNPSAFGIAMPCQVRNFTVTDSRGNEIITLNKETRYLIEPEIITRFGRRKMPITNFNLLNFTLDFGYESTGCVFASNEPTMIVNPPVGWLEGRDPITCYTCQNAGSEAECRRRGGVKLCRSGEICQSEVRQLANRRVSITKTCKQSNACENNWLHNNRQQCRPGYQASVCRCCCSEDRCNKDALQCT